MDKRIRNTGWMITATLTLALVLSAAGWSVAAEPGGPGAKAPGVKAPSNKIVDSSLRVYLDSTKVKYERGEQPVALVYIRNESKETRYFKRMWSPSGAGGVCLRTFINGVESWGSGMFRREPVEPESDDPAQAIAINPSQQVAVLKLVFLRLEPGTITVSAEYEADYKVVEKSPRNWWNGLARSNSLTLVIKKELPGSEIAVELSGVIEAIHGDVMKIRGDYTELTGYGDGALIKGADDALPGTRSIRYVTPRPGRFELRVYFNSSDFQPNTLAMLSEGFPFLGVNLFAHIDAGENARLRAALIDIVRVRGRALNKVVQRFEQNLTVEVQPFEAVLGAEFERAPIVIRGLIREVGVDSGPQSEYELRKWLLNVDVKETYKGWVDGADIRVKCGTLNIVFGDENAKGKEFILMMLEKSPWHKEYTLIGSQLPNDNLINWLKRKYLGEE